MFSLEGKTALVTGAGSGIGAAIGTVLAGAGAKVWVTDLNEKTAAETAQTITEAGGRAEVLALDVTNEDACARVVERILKQDSHLDLLVNNAGIGVVGTIVQTSGADFDRILQVNVRGIFNLCRAFLPSMLARRKGNIINLASIGGVVAVRDRFAYTTSKFAVVGLTKSIALDFAQEGIRCNCLCPGRVETPFMRARIAEYPDPDQARREMSATQAIGRMADPAEIAAAALYLAADESAFITGTAFIIDGGWTAGK
ncbi:MAG: glucose 1-dehydrogenase [Pedosphaera sp.]|nr:glucose 1-dehydrogenase [Pedosphaera sp.]